MCFHCLLSVCGVCLFPVLVFGAGFCFWLLRFLFVAFLLLLTVNIVHNVCVFLCSVSFTEDHMFDKYVCLVCNPL